MNCPYQNTCGGCPLRHLNDNDYREYKINHFKKIISQLSQTDIIFDEPLFIADGKRRRAEFTFVYLKGKIQFGFNVGKSHDIVDITNCPALTTQINDIIPVLKNFLNELCQISNSKKIKNKIITSNISGGDVFVTFADNGLGVLLTIPEDISLEQRMCICDFANSTSKVIRVAVKKQHNDTAEIIIEKGCPYTDISNHRVFISPGSFLQASLDGEQALIKKVLEYVGDKSYKIADLFCGIGTFSYALSDNVKNKITAADCSEYALQSFQKTVNSLTIHNINIVRRNLFKYPFDTQELKDFDIIILDPPRAGASAQINQITLLNHTDKPQKIVAVSCNPHTFINDAKQLLSGGYKLCRITMVDQFVYANHLELVALFEKY